MAGVAWTPPPALDRTDVAALEAMWSDLWDALDATLTADARRPLAVLDGGGERH